MRKLPDGRHEVTLKYPHVMPVLDFCLVDETRRDVSVAFNSRCKDKNGPILREVVQLRHQIAAILGERSHAHYVVEPLMAKSADAVMTVSQH